MSWATASLPTLDHYAFDLRSGLREAATQGLSSLEQTINEFGYGWLEGYMEGILAGASSNAAITQLIKTPSRTHGTAKKTRATTAAGNERADKVKALNAKAGMSPMSKVTNTWMSSRQPLSPLQPRLLNLGPTSTPHSPLAGSPAKGKSPANKAEKGKEKPTRGKGKGKKAKGKKVDQEDEAMVQEKVDEPMVWEEAIEDLPSSKRSSKSSNSSTKSKAATIPNAPLPASKSIALCEADTLEEHGMGNEGPIPQSELEETARRNEVELSRPTSLAPTAQTAPTDLSMIVEGDEDASAASNRSASASVSTSAVTSQKSAEPADEFEEAIIVADPSPSSSKLATPKQAEVANVGSTSHGDAHAEKSVSVSAPQQHPVNPPIPVRQVRSSWLSKALGTGTVPITGLTQTSSSTTSASTTNMADKDALRKSFAAPSQRPPQVDFSTLRKSLVPVGTLKRKSEIGVDEDEKKRPDKVSKVEVALPATTPGPSSVLQRPAFDRQQSRERESIFTARPTSAPQALPVTTPGPAFAPELDSQDPVNDRHRSDIHKVTKALDELRERAREKEAAKAKAMAVAASAGPKRVSTAAPPASTGTGFLRGLGSAGVGLGKSLGLGSQKNAEEEAARLRREEEEERRASMEAKEELARLMGEVEKGSPRKAKEQEEQREKPEGLKATVAVAESLAEPTQSLNAGARDDVDEDMDDEQQVNDSIDLEQAEQIEQTEFVKAPQPSSGVSAATLVSPPRLPRPVLQSTTPMETPPYTAPVRGVPVIHARQEKHQQSSPAKTSAQGSPRAKGSGSEQILVKHASDEDLPAPPVGINGRPVMHADDNPADDVEEEKQQEREVVGQPFERETFEVPTVDSTVSLPQSQTLSASVSSQATANGLLGHAAVIAGKVMGVKPAAAPPKSVQLAASAAKKVHPVQSGGKVEADEISQELAVSERRAASKDEIERRKRELAERRAEQDRLKEEEIRRARMAELEEKRRQRAEQERKRREAEERRVALTKAKAEREEEEREREAAAKAKMEEEANKKRKLMQSLNKSTCQQSQIKRIVPTAPQQAPPMPATQGLKGKEPMRPTRSIAGPATNVGMAPKIGPTSFRTTVQEQPHQTHSSTISLVTPQAQVVRTSVAQHHHQQQHHAHAQTHIQLHQQQGGSAVLQQSRAALQQTLDERAMEVQSEDIVLPDIASEYSNSDDEDRTRDFERPTWAESPELRAALKEQAYRDPDELFGPIKPISMEELFKVRQGKFRARTSSANWAKGDGLTRAEEVEYAKRMGFRPVGQRGEGSGQGV